MSDDSTKSGKRTPTQFFLRGLAISLPAILTIIIIIWIASGVHTYLIHPTTSAVKWTLAQFVDRSVSIRNESGESQLVRLRSGPELDFCGKEYLVTSQLKREFQTWRETGKPATDSAEDAGARVADATANQTTDATVRGDNTRTRNTDATANQIAEVNWLEDRINQVYVPFGNEAVPYADFVSLRRETHPKDMPTSATGLYMELAAERYFSSAFVLSSFAVVLVIVALYFLGRFVSVRVGGWFVHQFENNLLGRLPVIRNVYGSTKQVTDFLFTESQVEYRRVVAIEYPRRGIWSLGLVTGESMLDITAAVGEPCLSVLVPSSPMPVTGYTMSVPRSQVLDLNITVDQAFQFCISCGVLVPPNQKVTPQLLQERLQRRLAEELNRDATLRRRDGFTAEARASGPESSADTGSPGNGPEP